MIVLISQMLFTFTKFFARYNLSGAGDFIEGLRGNWLYVYICVHTAATFMQLYVFHKVDILKAMVFFTGASLILTVILGYFVFHEVLDLQDIISVILVLSALLIIHSDKKTRKNLPNKIK